MFYENTNTFKNNSFKDALAIVNYYHHSDWTRYNQYVPVEPTSEAAGM